MLVTSSFSSLYWFFNILLLVHLKVVNSVVENRIVLNLYGTFELNTYKMKSFFHFICYQLLVIFDLLMGEAQVILCSLDIAAVLFILNNGQCILFQVHPIGIESHHRDAEGTDSKVPIKLKTFVELTMDIASASPSRYFFEARMLYVFCSSIFKQTKDAILCNMLLQSCSLFHLSLFSFSSHLSQRKIYLGRIKLKEAI